MSIHCSVDSALYVDIVASLPSPAQLSIAGTSVLKVMVNWMGIWEQGYKCSTADVAELIIILLYLAQGLYIGKN